MADYIAMGRTNYFHVTDEDKYQELIKGLVSNGYWYDFSRVEDSGVIHAFGFDGCFDWTDPEDEDQDSNLDYFLDEIQKILPDGEAFMCFEIGHEKFRYVVGEVCVVTKPEIAWFNLDHIAMDWAKNILGPEFTTQTTY